MLGFSTHDTGTLMSELNRALGLPMLTFYGTGMILGAGIYTIIGKAAGVAGPNVWLSLVFAALAATFAALSYCELAAMFPKVGGEYVYLKKAFPSFHWIANSGGLMMSFAGIATASTVSLAFAGYLQQFFSFSPLLIAMGLLTIFTIINILGIKESSWMNVIFTLIEISGLVIFIYIGIQSSNFGNALLSMPSLTTVTGSALIIFAFFGFENIVNFAEEVKNPQKNLPRAILLSIGISTVLYILVALSAVSLMPINELAQSKAPLSDAIRNIAPKMAGALAGIALFATANTVLIALVTTSRILFGMARENALPLSFAKLHQTRQTPWFSSIVTFILAACLLPLNKVEVLASISSFATMIAFIAVHVALITLRIQAPSQERPFRIPLSIKNIPILPVLGGALTILLLFQFDETVYIIGGVFLSIILVFQLILKFLNKTHLKH